MGDADKMNFWRALEVFWAFAWLCFMGYAVWRLWVGRRMAKVLRERMEAHEEQRIHDATVKLWKTKPKSKGDEKC